MGQVGPILALALSTLDASPLLTGRLETTRDGVPSLGGRGGLTVSDSVRSWLGVRAEAQCDLSSMRSIQGIAGGSVRDARLGAAGTIVLPRATWIDLSISGASSGSSVLPEAAAAAGWHPGSGKLEVRAATRRCDDGIRIRMLHGRETAGSAVVGWKVGDRAEWELSANRSFVDWDSGNVVRRGGWTWLMVRALSWKGAAFKVGGAASWADASRSLNHATGSEPKTAQVDDSTTTTYYRYLYAVDPLPVALDQWQALGLASASVALGGRAFLNVSCAVPLRFLERRTAAWPDSGLSPLPAAGEGGSSSWWLRSGGSWQASGRLDARVGAYTWIALEASATRNPDYWVQKLSFTVNTPLP